MNAHSRDHAHHPQRVSAAQATDSAGASWRGRELTPSGFETDDGRADEALRAILRSPAVSEPDTMAAVPGGRFLVPIVAEPGPTGLQAGLKADPHVDMAAVTLVAPDGRRALPVFTGIDSLAAWDPAARPVPVTAQRMAEAALDEGCDVIVIDVASPPVTLLRTSMIWALAQRRAWQAPDRDPQVAAGVSRALGAHPDVTAYTMTGGAQGDLVLTLTVRAGLTPDAVRALTTAVAADLGRDDELRVRLDGLTLRLT